MNRFEQLLLTLHRLIRRKHWVLEYYSPDKEAWCEFLRNSPRWSLEDGLGFLRTLKRYDNFMYRLYNLHTGDIILGDIL